MTHPLSPDDPRARQARLQLAGGVQRHDRSEAGLRRISLSHPGGSALLLTQGPDDRWTVTTSGPTDLWASVEAAHQRWLALNRPRREWFEITLTPTNQQLAHTAPDGQRHRWELPA